jgi:cation diffusion facilitator family transporter
MTNFLLRKFVNDYDNPNKTKARTAVGKFSGTVGIVCNAVLCVMKLVVGTLSGSVSITADAMNNLTDATSAIVTLVGFKLSEKPADEDHPYGHARYEYLSGLAVAALIIVIGFELAKTSVGKIFHPEAVAFSVPMAIVLVCSVALKLWMSRFNQNLGRQIDSGALLATAADSRNDAIATSAVLAAALLEMIFGWKIDGIMGLAVAAFILYSGVNLAKETISPLLGETASPELRNLIVGVVADHPKILGYHDLMVHDYGPGQRFASMHVEMDQREDPLECHELIDNLERSCLEKHNVHLVLHYDPVVTDDEELKRIRGVVEEILQEQDERITIHDFRTVRGKGHTNLIFDMALPSELMSRRKQIKKEMDEALSHREQKTYFTVVTFDIGVFN